MFVEILLLLCIGLLLFIAGWAFYYAFSREREW